MKYCSKCGELKPLDEFYATPQTRDGRRGDCKACFAARAKARYDANPDAVKDRVRRWQKDNPERLRAWRKKYREGQGRINDRESYLKRKYGITIAQYDEMLAAQGGVCAICGRQPRDDISLHVDHDHKTGARRGLLCFRCNNALGDFDDDPDLMIAGAAYLISHDPEMQRMADLTRARVAQLTQSR